MNSQSYSLLSTLYSHSQQNIALILRQVFPFYRLAETFPIINALRVRSHRQSARPIKVAHMIVWRYSYCTEYNVIGYCNQCIGL